jgi:hypothetical protein
MSDATMKLLTDLEDPRLYRKVEAVPIFAEHTRTVKGKDGKPTVIDVGVPRLKKIAARINTREQDTGTLGVLKIGHTKRDPEHPEEAQPRVVGYFRAAAVGGFGPKQKPALLVTYYVKRECEAEAKEYPFRSPEFYPDADEITAVSLLKRDPELDLGILTYDRAGRAVYHYAMDDDMSLSDPASPIGAETPQESPEDEQHYRRFCGYMKRYMAESGSLALPGAENVEEPGGAPPPPEEEHMTREPRKPAEHYAREVERQVKPVKDELVKVKAENDRLRLDYARKEAAEVFRDLREKEGFLISEKTLDRKVEQYARGSEATRAEIIEDVRENCRRDPAGGPDIPVADDVARGPRPGTDAHRKLVERRAQAASAMQIKDGHKKEYAHYYQRAEAEIN